MAVAEREGLAGLSVNRVVAEAGVAKGTFYVHFADREAFVDALHERFHERVIAAVDAATAGTPPGAERIWLGRRGLPRRVPVRTCDQGAGAGGAHRHGPDGLDDRPPRAVRRGAIPSIRAMGWPEATAAAQLLAAMTSEIAIRELEAGRRLPAARRSLRRFLGLPAAA